MKTLYSLLFFALCAQLVMAANDVPNPGYENWTSGNPDGWYTTNYTGIGTPVTQSSTRHGGSFAVKGQAVYSSTLMDTIPPAVGSGSLGTPYFAVTHQYNKLEFYYQCSLSGGDAFTAVAVAYSGSSPIGGGTLEITASAGGWTHGIVDINYGSTITGMSITFTLAAPNTGDRSQPLLSSTFLVDDVTLSGDVGIQDINSANYLRVFPVPAHDMLTVNTSGIAINKAVTLLLTDAMGRTLRQVMLSEQPSFLQYNMDLKGIVPGFYSLMIMNEEKSFVRNVIVE